jgi:hypothetical protein
MATRRYEQELTEATEDQQGKVGEQPTKDPGDRVGTARTFSEPVFAAVLRCLR